MCCWHLVSAVARKCWFSSKNKKTVSYLRGVPSSWGWIITTLTLTDVRSRSIICSWVRVATATLQISTSRLPCLSPAFQAKPKGSTSATMPSKLTWKPSWPRPFRRKVISDVSQPLVVIWNRNQNQFVYYLQHHYIDFVLIALFLSHKNSRTSEICGQKKFNTWNGQCTVGNHTSKTENKHEIADRERLIFMWLNKSFLG